MSLLRSARHARNPKLAWTTTSFLAGDSRLSRDQFLANAQQLGRGLGRAMVDAFVQQLFKDPAVTKVQTDPSPRNERAIRSYRRAGFAAHGEIDTPDGKALPMLRHR